MLSVGHLAFFEVHWHHLQLVVHPLHHSVQFTCLEPSLVSLLWPFIVHICWHILMCYVPCLDMFWVHWCHMGQLPTLPFQCFKTHKSVPLPLMLSMHVIVSTFRGVVKSASHLAWWQHWQQQCDNCNGAVITPSSPYAKLASHTRTPVGYSHRRVYLWVIANIPAAKPISTMMGMGTLWVLVQVWLSIPMGLPVPFPTWENGPGVLRGMTILKLGHANNSQNCLRSYMPSTITEALPHPSVSAKGEGWEDAGGGGGATGCDAWGVVMFEEPYHKM